MDDPSLIGTADHRLLGTMKSVLQPCFHPHLQGFVEAAINRHSADVERSLDHRRTLPGVITGQNPSPFDLWHRCRTRTAQFLQALFFLVRERVPEVSSSTASNRGQ